MAELDSLINSKISLITHQDVRYDGTLFSINQAESSLVLKDVRCYGTEDRVKELEGTVPGNTVVLTFVTFPGTDIKELYVHEAPAATPPPAPAPVPKTATPVTATYADVPPPVPTAHKKPASNHNNNNNHNNARPQHTPSAHKPAPQQHHAAPTPASVDASGAKPAGARAPRSESSAGTGSHLLRMKERKGANDGTAPEGAEGEFDFTQGLKVFNKEEVSLGNGGDTKTKYVKDDFFDNLTNDKSDGRGGGRLSAADERHLNQDTFGAIALQNNRRGGGRGRGRGSGRGNGTSGGAGRGRGGNGARGRGWG